jgi:hypothetical protein
VRVEKVENLAPIKKLAGVPRELESCHTTVIGDYVVANGPTSAASPFRACPRGCPGCRDKGPIRSCFIRSSRRREPSRPSRANRKTRFYPRRAPAARPYVFAGWVPACSATAPCSWISHAP